MKNADRTTEKVVPFAQSTFSAKAFRHDYPVSDDVKEELLLEVYKDFTHFFVKTLLCCVPGDAK